MDALPPLKKEQQFLVTLLTQALEAGILLPDELLARFPPSAIMQEVFRDRPERRADILGMCVGVKRGTALRTTPETATENLVTALEVEDTSAAEIVAAVGAEDYVRALPATEAYHLVMTKPWTTEVDAERKRITCMQALLIAIIELDLLAGREQNKTLNTHHQLVKAIGHEHLMGDEIPKDLRGAILKLALALGETPAGEKKPEPLTAKILIGHLKPEVLTKYLPLSTLAPALEAVRAKFDWKAPAPPAELSARATDALESAVAPTDDDDQPRTTVRPPPPGKDGDVEVEVSEEIGDPGEPLAPEKPAASPSAPKTPPAEEKSGGGSTTKPNGGKDARRTDAPLPDISPETLEGVPGAAPPIVSKAPPQAPPPLPSGKR